MKAEKEHLKEIRKQLLDDDQAGQAAGGSRDRSHSLDDTTPDNAPSLPGQRPGICPGCGYDFSRLDSPTACPNCGRPLY